MVSQPKPGRPAERRDEVSRYDVGCRPVLSRCTSWFGEGNIRLFDLQTGDRTHGDLRRAPLKEAREEGVT